MIQRYAQFWFFRKGSGNNLSTTLCVWFFKKNISHVILYYLGKCYCLIALFSWDIGKRVLQVFVGQVVTSRILKLFGLIFLIAPFSCVAGGLGRGFGYLGGGNGYWGGIKSIFHLFKRAFRCQGLSQTLECTFKIFNPSATRNSTGMYQFITNNHPRFTCGEIKIWLKVKKSWNKHNCSSLIISS